MGIGQISRLIFSFFTASFSESEKVRIDKEFTTPFKFLFVGSLVAGKKPLYAIKLIEALMAKAIPVTLDLYGDGILKKSWRSMWNKKIWIHLLHSVEIYHLKRLMWYIKTRIFDPCLAK